MKTYYNIKVLDLHRNEIAHFTICDKIYFDKIANDVCILIHLPTEHATVLLTQDRYKIIDLEKYKA